MATPPVLLVVGARNSGRAVLADRLAAGWRAVALVRTEATAAALAGAHADAVVVRGDAADPDVTAEAIARAERDLGGLDLVVNAASAAPGEGPFGGGPVAEAPPDRLEAWLAGFLPVAWTVLRLGGAALARRGAGTLVQLAGGSARRGIPSRGPWGAAQGAARALVQAAAQELRGQGVHVALLVADGTIATDRAPRSGRSGEQIQLSDVAAAVAYLAGQGSTAWTHELVITPAGDIWTP